MTDTGWEEAEDPEYVFRPPLRVRFLLWLGPFKLWK